MALPRKPWRLLVAPVRAANYRTVLRSFRTYEQPARVLWRYVTNRGAYPFRLGLKTPTGPVAVHLPSFHDLRTANEIFNRGDYEVSPGARVVVDLGANIGLSALYFLTRNRDCRVYCFEPAPLNLPRLREALSPYADRVVIDPRAVSDRSGTFAFNAEPVGRYSGLVTDAYTEPVVNVIEVEVAHVDTVIEDVLRREPRIDVLKIDTEGTELPIVRTIRPDLLDRIGEILIEARVSEPLHPGRFAQDNPTPGIVRLRNLRWPPAPQGPLQ